MRKVYVVGIGQKQHFDMLFAAARKVGFVDDRVSLNHLGFGNGLPDRAEPTGTGVAGASKWPISVCLQVVTY